MQGIVNMKIKTLGANLTLILVAFIWGSAFVAQNSAGDVLGTFSINFSRYIVAGVALIPVYLFFSRHENKKTPDIPCCSHTDYKPTAEQLERFDKMFAK